MRKGKKYLIGGSALVKLGSSRGTLDRDYLVELDSTDPFVVDGDDDLINANGHPFFREVMDLQGDVLAEIASPQVLLELKAFSFVQHCANFHFQKADNDEYDIKFIVRNLGVSDIKIAWKYMNPGQLAEVRKVINSVK